jgi:hypothetical protein
MKPQPEHVSMLIKKRIMAREKRLLFKARLIEDLNDLRLESAFEEGLRSFDFEPVFSPRRVLDEWGICSIPPQIRWLLIGS